MRTSVILDKHPLWCEAVAITLRRLEIAVAGIATSRAEALDLIVETKPDLLVTGLHLHADRFGGLECIRAAQSAVPTLKAIVFSASSEGPDIRAALESGALAYVDKEAHPDDFAAAVRQAFGHHIHFASVANLRPRNGLHGAHGDACAQAGLTRREREILLLAAEGLSNAAVASRLWVTEQTVKFHLSNAYRKLGVSNRTEASHWVATHVLVPLAAESG